MSDTQNPGGWPDAAYITAVADAVFDATGLVLGYVTAAEMARFVQAREAAARLEGFVEGGKEALANALHPEFGSIYAEDGEATAAHKAGRREGIKAAWGVVADEPVPEGKLTFHEVMQRDERMMERIRAPLEDGR